ncbi:MAG: DUF2130 domain-containing protein [Pseudolabrys sp.]|nr:DUF2130 domain-containing protein [Pseudolabrys sp.]MDP2297883.1 DUF2130 domain-containing protein [Pseudolabrys sp.]
MSIMGSSTPALAAGSPLRAPAALAERRGFGGGGKQAGVNPKPVPAAPLRQGLIEVSSTRLVQQGQQTKMEQVYHYLTGNKFRQRVEAVIEKFNDMREDLDRERKFIGCQKAKRETQIILVIESTVGMVGDLQAIAGKAMPEIAHLDTPLLEDGSPPGAQPPEWMRSSTWRAPCPRPMKRRSAWSWHVFRSGSCRRRQRLRPPPLSWPNCILNSRHCRQSCYASTPPQAFSVGPRDQSFCGSFVKERQRPICKEHLRPSGRRPSTAFRARQHVGRFDEEPRQASDAQKFHGDGDYKKKRVSSHNASSLV